MCGIVGIYSHQIVNQLLYDGLQLLQHRGQDAAGIVTMDGSMKKNKTQEHKKKDSQKGETKKKK